MASIKLPQPCNELWQAMEPVAGGRFCGNCCQTVIDFTQWTPASVLAYLRQHPGTCGRFRKDQLDHPVPEPEVFIAQLNRSPLPFLSRIALVVVFVFAIMSTACNTATQSEAPPAVKETSEQQLNGAPLTVVDVPQPPDSTGTAPKLRRPLRTASPPQPGDVVYPQPSEHMGGAPVIEEEPVILPPPDTLSPPGDG